MSSKSRVKQPTHKSLANEVLAVVLVAIAALLLLSVITYDPNDPSWNTISPPRHPNNIIGTVGAHIGDFFLQLFGLASLVIPILLILIAARAFFSDQAGIHARKAIGAVLLLIAFSGFLALFPKPGLKMLEHAGSNGGAVGYI